MPRPLPALVFLTFFKFVQQQRRQQQQACNTKSAQWLQFARMPCNLSGSCSFGHLIAHACAGVVGFTPDLKPGAVFQYHSGTTLSTANGTMQGSFQMVPLNELERPGPSFDAVIAPFALLGDKARNRDDG